MPFRIANPKDFWAGLIYVGIAAGALWIGASYKMGVAGRMGPGYFPFVLACLLLGLGLISLARSLVSTGEPISRIAWKPLVLIVLANVFFGFLLPRVGFVLALAFLMIVSASASRKFRVDWKAAAGLVLLIAFCMFVFVKGLGIPMPLVGSWLEPYISFLGV